MPESPHYRTPNFMKLYSAQVISLAGDSLTEIAIAVFALRVSHHSALAFGGILAIGLLPQVLFGWLWAGLVDRWHRKHLLITADFIRAGLVLSIPLVGSLAWAMVVVFMVQTLGMAYRPVSRAILPETVPSDSLTSASASLEGASNVLSVLGFALAGALILSIGLSGAFYLDALSFLLSGLAILWMKLPQEVWLPPVKKERHFWSDIGDGIRFHRQTPIVGRFLLVTMLGSLGIYGLNLLIPIFTREILHRPTGDYSFLMAGMAVGMVLGSVLVERVGDRIDARSWISAGSLSIAIGIVVAAWLPAWWVAMAGFAMAGAGNMVFLIPMRSRILSATPSEMRGRVFALRGFAIGLSGIVSVGLGGFITRLMGVQAVMTLFAAILFLTTLLNLVHQAQERRGSGGIEEAS